MLQNKSWLRSETTSKQILFGMQLDFVKPRQAALPFGGAVQDRFRLRGGFRLPLLTRVCTTNPRIHSKKATPKLTHRLRPKFHFGKRPQSRSRSVTFFDYVALEFLSMPTR